MMVVKSIFIRQDPFCEVKAGDVVYFEQYLEDGFLLVRDYRGTEFKIQKKYVNFIVTTR